MPASLEQPVEPLPLNPDEQGAMAALSPEGHNSLENMRASFRQEQAELIAAGSTTYKSAVELKGMFGRNSAVIKKFRQASHELIAATAIDSVVGTGETADQPQQPISPKIYLQIADSLAERAIASEGIEYDDPLASTIESRKIDARKYLGPKAIRFFDKGVQLLLETEPGNPPTDMEIPDNAGEVVASAFVNAVKVADDTQEHKVLANTSEEEIAAELEAKGTEELDELLDRVPEKKAQLEVVSLASRQLAGELSNDHHPLSLAA